MCTRMVLTVTMVASVLATFVMGDGGNHSADAPEDYRNEMTHEMHSVDETEGHWMAPPEAAGTANPVPATEESLALGRAVYEQYCSSCHGENARGDGPAAASLPVPPTDLQVMSGEHPDGDLAWKIAHGRGPMPPWEGILSEEQIWHVVNYLKSLSR